MATQKIENRMISEKEKEAVAKLFEDFDKLVEVHTKEGLQKLGKDVRRFSVVERLHTLTYINVLGDLIPYLISLKNLWEMTEEEFIEIVEESGRGKSLETIEEEYLEASMMKAVLRNGSDDPFVGEDLFKVGLVRK